MTGDSRIHVGRLGERLAAERLESSGFRVIERNFRTREGEIDLIVHRAPLLVFCEVKTIVARANGRGPAYPLEAVRATKRARIRRLARAWMVERSPPPGGFRSVRFDAIGVLLSPAGELLGLEHVEAAF